MAHTKAKICGAHRAVIDTRGRDEEVHRIVFAEDYYAIFAIEEFVILLGVIPKVCMRASPVEVRRRYGLPSAA